MSDLRSNVKTIQREIGVEPDGVFGPVTAARVLHYLQRDNLPLDAEKVMPAAIPEESEFDPRTEQRLASLDRKAVPAFRRFIALAKATAATLGCDYVAISGNRTYAEQDALYEQGRSKPGKRVTNAKGGQSNHNFGIAIDFGVFQGGVYLDDGNRVQASLASKVHKACSMHADGCGLEWGGDWHSIKDEPHYEIATGLTMAAKRELMAEKGSVL
jgi:peptidoglycan L-alanyl-D-glutamate endopeptidase CwlK